MKVVIRLITDTRLIYRSVLELGLVMYHDQCQCRYSSCIWNFENFCKLQLFLSFLCHSTQLLIYGLTENVFHSANHNAVWTRTNQGRVQYLTRRSGRLLVWKHATPTHNAMARNDAAAIPAGPLAVNLSTFWLYQVDFACFFVSHVPTEFITVIVLNGINLLD